MFKKRKSKQQTIKKLQKKADEYLAGWKRAQADYQNLKKRLASEQKDYIKFANEDLILEILPILDNFQSAYSVLPKELENNSWIKGIKYIKTQLEDILKKNNVKKIKALNQEFNPELHEAIKQKNKKVQKKTKLKVFKILLTGYKLNNKVIRPTKVEVK